MEHITTISFPGLGIGEFKLSNVAFTVFGYPIMWYGIIITAGIIVAFLYACYRAKNNESILSDDMIDYAIFAVIFGVIGARLYYVITEFDRFKGENFGETLGNILAIRNGGLGIYGGIIAGIIAIFVTSRVKKQSVAKVLDAVAPGVMLAQAIGRWGNFFNGEAFGSVTRLPLRMCGPGFASYLSSEGFIDADTYRQIITGTAGVHPTFLYESVFNIIGFIIINALYKKKKFNGQIVLMYLTWYGLGRFFIEGLRTDSLYFLKPLLGETIRISQAIAALCFIGGTAALIILSIRNKNKTVSEASETESTNTTEDNNNETD